MPLAWWLETPRFRRQIGMPKPWNGNRDNRARVMDGPKETHVTNAHRTKPRIRGNGAEQMAPHPLVGEDWPRVLELMPTMDLEASALDTKTSRRRREVRTGADLPRLVLACALCGWPLLMVGAWACLAGVANLSGVALRKRLRATRMWMGLLVAAWVTRNRTELAGCIAHLRLVDATTVSGPGSNGTDWRVHVSLDLSRMCIDGVDLTDGHGGETLVRHPAQPGDIQVADRGYCRRPAMGETLSQGGDLVVRVHWQNLPMKDEGGRPVDLFEWLAQVPATEPAERRVIVQTPSGDYEMRLVARRLSQEAADRARQQVRRQSSKKERTPSQRSLQAAGFIILVTSLPATPWSASKVLALYRLRWQVEMMFKRLKGVLSLDGLAAKDPDLAQVYILGNLLGAMLADRLSRSGPAECAEWFSCVDRPLSPWRWLTWWMGALCSAILGPISLDRVLAALPELGRYFRDTPRRRRQHCALARCLARLLGEPSTIPQRVAHMNEVLLQPAYA